MQNNELIGKTTTFSRYKKLADDEPISLGGEDPPSGLINPEYKQQPSNPRKCIECGKMHDTIVENMTTGNRIEEIQKCKDCLFSPIFKQAMGKFDFPISNESALHNDMKKLELDAIAKTT